MEIQPVIKTDLDSILALVKGVAEHDVLPLLNQQGQTEFRSRVLTDIEKTLDKRSFITLKATVAGEVVGFGALRGGSYLTHLFVCKKTQGLGVGKALLEALLNSTEAREVTLRSSINAVSFYEYYGFNATDDESEFNGIRFVPMCLVRA